MRPASFRGHSIDFQRAIPASASHTRAVTDGGSAKYTTGTALHAARSPARASASVASAFT